MNVRQRDREISESSDDASVDVRVVALDLIADGVIVADDGVITYVNKPAQVLFGFQRDELIGAPIEMLVPESARVAHRRRRTAFTAHAADRQMGRADLDIEGQRADGTRFPIDVKLASIVGTGAVVATIRDMTGERQMVADRAIDRLDLLIARRRIDRLVASHDLVVQRLFALATGFRAQRQREGGPVGHSLDRASQALDELIEVIRHDALNDLPPVVAADLH